jgi:YihY family inner membrane protein
VAGRELAMTDKPGSHAMQTIRYLLSLESHTYAFAIAANILLSFFPFMVLVLSLVQNVLHVRAAADMIYAALRDLLPEDPGLLDFVMRNLHVAVESRGRAEALSALTLIFSSNGVFVTMEVALNKLWGFKSNRSYWHNQAISLVLTFVCGLLALLAALAAASGAGWLRGWLAPYLVLPETVTSIVVKLVSLLLSITIATIVYVVLPNGHVATRRTLGIAVYVGLALELAKAAYLLFWPHLGFRNIYGPFFVSVTLMLEGYVAALIVLAGGEIAARGRTE